MIVYLATKADFRADILSNRIEEKILDSFKGYKGLLKTKGAEAREKANLKNVRKFYLTFPDREKSYTLCSLLTWSHNRLIKDETIVQYSVLKGSEQLFASKYRTVLPTEAELIAELERERRVIEEKQNGGDP